MSTYADTVGEVGTPASSTFNVNSACEVLWISRQVDEQVQTFFDKARETGALVNVPDSVNELLGVGAVWLTNDFETSYVGSIDADYLYPRGYSDIIGASWSKDTTSPAGVFNVQLKPRLPYDIYIKPGDLFIVFMDDDHRYDEQRAAGTLISAVLVDRVAKSTSVNGDGATVEMVRVSCRDLGVIFQKTETVFDKAFAIIDQTMFQAKYVTEFADKNVTAMSPVESFCTMLSLIYDQNATNSRLVGAQWTFHSVSNTDSTGRPVSLLRLIDATSFLQVPMFGYTLPNTLALAQAGNVWSLLEGYANRAINEFFVDVRDAMVGDLVGGDASLMQLGGVAAAFVSDDDAKRQYAVVDALRNSGVFASKGTIKKSPPGSNDPAEIDFDEPAEFQGAPEIDFDDPEEVIGNPGRIVAAASQPVMAVVLRQLPYDHDAFMALPVNELHHTECSDVDVGVSDHDVVNFFKARFPDVPETLQEFIIGLLINAASITKFGIRRMEIESRYLFATAQAGVDYRKSGTADFSAVFNYYVQLLATWYAANELMLAGDISCRFSPRIRVGTRLRFHAVDGNIYNYYVQGVNHTFSVQPGASRTHLTVVRGRNEQDNGIVNNLKWGPSADAPNAGRQIPDELDNYIKVKPAEGQT